MVRVSASWTTSAPAVRRELASDPRPGVVTLSALVGSPMGALVAQASVVHLLALVLVLAVAGGMALSLSFMYSDL